MYIPQGTTQYRTLLEGIEMKTLAYGEKSMMVEFFLHRDCSLPRHSHPHEQTGYLVSGRLRFYIGDNVYDAQPGDSWSIPGGVVHWTDILEDSIVVEVFSPVREDYLSK